MTTGSMTEATRGSHARRSRTRLRNEARTTLSAAHVLLLGPEPTETLLRRAATLLPRRWWRPVIAVGAVLLALLGVVTLVQLARTRSTVGTPLLMVLAVASTVPVALALDRPLLAWRLSAPVALLALLLPAVAPLSAGSVTAVSFSEPTLVGVLQMLVLAQLAASAPGRVALAAALIDLVLLLPVLAWSTSPDALEAVTVLVLVTGLGISARAWGATSNRLETQRRNVVEEQARRAVLEERARIARELHDVVAHHLSLIAVRAETAPYRIPDLGDAADEELGDIGTAARSALVEMRRLLGVLRSEDDGHHAELSPQPQLSDIPELVAAARRSGLTVRLTGSAEPSLGSPAVELTAYASCRRR